MSALIFQEEQRAGLKVNCTAKACGEPERAWKLCQNKILNYLKPDKKADSKPEQIDLITFLINMNIQYAASESNLHNGGDFEKENVIGFAPVTMQYF